MTTKPYSTSSNKFIKHKTLSKPIKILEPFSPDPITFDSIDEFRSYLEEHEEEMNEITTQRLNRLYKIDGYKITKLLNKETHTSDISLRKVKEKEQAENGDEASQLIKMITDKLVEIEERLVEIEKRI